jgi:hypothetical protein
MESFPGFERAERHETKAPMIPITMAMPMDMTMRADGHWGCAQ